MKMRERGDKREVKMRRGLRRRVRKKYRKDSSFLSGFIIDPGSGTRPGLVEGPSCSGTGGQQGYKSLSVPSLGARPGTWSQGLKGRWELQSAEGRMRLGRMENQKRGSRICQGIRVSPLSTGIGEVQLLY